MKLKDRNLLAALLAAQGVSARQVAGAAGWKSHSYMNRLITGEATTVKTEAAGRIAKYLGVPVTSLFVPTASIPVAQTVQSRRAS